MGPNPNRQVKQISFRPAVDIAARLETLEEVIKNRNRTELINDMLERALKIVEEEVMDIGGHEDEELQDGSTIRHYNDLSLWTKYEKALVVNLIKFQSEATTKDD